jgi:hypothetical protein
MHLIALVASIFLIELLNFVSSRAFKPRYEGQIRHN